ncbi:MAG: TIGR00730 family Rossman fold protein, partial [Acidobacteriaceae bacterium]
ESCSPTQFFFLFHFCFIFPQIFSAIAGGAVSKPPISYPLMGVIADSVLAGGGEVIGVIPQQLVDSEVAHRGLTELHIVRTMHERKHRMAGLADAFVALPGGYGTLDELCEVLGWAQLSIHEKPIVLLDVMDYWQSLFAMFDRAVQEGFLKPENRRDAMRATSVAEVFRLLNAERPHRC